MSNRPDLEKSYDFSDESIGKIYITGGGFVDREFQGVSSDSMFGWEELVWKKSPSRSTGSFAFTNMDNIEVGLVPQCEIIIPFTDYESYMAMRKILKERRVDVRFFNADEGKWITRNMYCTENSKSKFFMMQKHLLGVRDYKLKFVGTNLDLEGVSDDNGQISYSIPKRKIKYNDSNSQTITVDKGEQAEIKSFTNDAVQTGKHFAGWIDKEGEKIVGYYKPEQKITVWKDLNLYTWWE